jgi:oxygen-independent coproporphyrinogen-3 oxidase
LLAVEKQRTGELVRTPLSARDQAVEYLLMGLRLRNGIDLARLERMSPDAIDARKVSGLEDLGLLEKANGSLRATDAGRPVLNAILREILLD